MACENDNKICCGACFVNSNVLDLVGKTIKSAHVFGELFVIETTEGTSFSTAFKKVSDHLIFFSGRSILNVQLDTENWSTCEVVTSNGTINVER